MLTLEAYRERKWGPFPALRKALEDKSVPADYYGTSVSDNIFAALPRLIEIAILAREHKAVVREVARSVGRDEMYHDLRRLEGELEGACSFLRQTAEDVRAIFSELRT